MAAKRGNNEGTIRKRPDGRWEARLRLPDGERKSFYGRRRADVARQMNEGMTSCEKGLPVVGERVSVARFMERWLESIKPTIGSRTWLRYQEYVNLHILPQLGRVVMSRLSPQQLQLLYARKLGEGYSSTTIWHLHSVIHASLADAMRLGIVQRNVSELVNVPRKVKREMATLTPEQAKAFLTAASGSRFEALYVLAITTGMRQGELFALKWRDVDLSTGIVQIRTSLQKAEEGLEFSQPKTARSRRNVSLTQVAIDALKRHKALQDEERLALGGAWEDMDLVFCNVLGGALFKSNVLYRSFKPLLARAGVPRIRFHDLRHTAATMMLLQGVHPKVVSEMLGHASIAITLDLYSHVLPNMQKDATMAIDRLFGNEGMKGVG